MKRRAAKRCEPRDNIDLYLFTRTVMALPQATYSIKSSAY
jgi:hypothetical protein